MVLHLDFGLQVVSCLFGVGLREEDHSTCALFLGDGIGDHCRSRPTYKLPIAGNMSSSSLELENGY
jgi:hypothetical protein